MANTIEADAIIVGGGFSGCLALHHLRQRGLSAKIIEAGSDFGGVWHFNKYPGVRVDTQTPLYQLDMPQSWEGFRFKEKFPGGAEIRDYFAHMDEKLGLRNDTLFHQRVVEAKYDAATQKWLIKTDKGLVAKSRFAIFATGATLKAYIPEYANLDNFAGTTIQPSAWPDNLDVKGKRVGIIGLGATGVQIVQELAKEDCELTVFVRTPHNILPMRQNPVPEEEHEAAKGMYAQIFNMAKYGTSFDFPSAAADAVSFYGKSPAEREAHLEALWETGSLGFINHNFTEVSFDREVNAYVYDFWAKKVRARMQDPVKRDIVAPLKQGTWFAGKRTPLEQDYFEMIDRPNVTVVDVKATPIKEFTTNGVVVAETTTGNDDESKLHELDVVVFATGYDSVTGSLYDMNIRDKHGRLLQEKWEDRIRTYLGLMVPDMPNAFFMYGPQAPTSYTFAPPFLQLEVDWILRVLDKMDEDGVRSVDVSDDEAEAWAQKNWDFYNATALLKETDSWWVGTNIPGKKREPLLWTAGMSTWWTACAKSLEDWPSNFLAA